MTLRALLRTEPWRFNFFRLFREYERSHPEKPRIGRNIVVREEYIRVEQEPFLDFPAANVTEFTPAEGGKPDRIKVRFLSYFGPQGALPHNLTEEVLQWALKKNFAFVHFADIFGTRFYHILYRAWCASRRICQFDRPGSDRYQLYIGALAGVPRTAKGELPDRAPAFARLDVAGLIGGRVRSPGRLRQIIETVMRVEVEVDEFIPVWVFFEDEDRSKLGARGSTLGMDLRLGSRVQTVSDKVRINVRTRGGADYDRFLPGRGSHEALHDLVRGYLGPAVDIEIAPSMPGGVLPAVRLGKAGAVGHTSWIAPRAPDPEAGDTHVTSAVFLHSAYRHEYHDEPAQGRATQHRERLH